MRMRSTTAAARSANHHEFRLFVAGSGRRSLLAVRNLKRLCERELRGRYRLEVIDLYQTPHRAAEDQVIAILMLVRHAPGSVKRLVGDLSQEVRVRAELGLPPGRAARDLN